MSRGTKNRGSLKDFGGKHYASQEEMRAAERMFTRVFRADATVKQRFRCIYCKCVMLMDDTTAEHAQPKSRGGATDRQNIKGACSLCNKAKGNGTEAWFRRILHGSMIPCDDPALRDAFIRFRLNSRVERAEKRIRRFVGMEDGR